MNFSAWAIRNPVPPILAFILMTVMGLMAFNRLEVQNFPDMTLPTISISATLEGAAAAQLETEVARKIEDRLTGLAMLDSVTTTITDGSVSISVAFQIGKDVQIAQDEVQNAVDQAQSDLPPGMNVPTVSKSSLGGSPLVTFVLSSDRLDDTELSWFIDNSFARAIMAVEGVGEVGRLGGVDREIQVELNPELAGRTWPVGRGREHPTARGAARSVGRGSRPWHCVAVLPGGCGGVQRRGVARAADPAAERGMGAAGRVGHRDGHACRPHLAGLPGSQAGDRRADQAADRLFRPCRGRRHPRRGRGLCRGEPAGDHFRGLQHDPSDRAELPCLDDDAV